MEKTEDSALAGPPGQGLRTLASRLSAQAAERSAGRIVGAMEKTANTDMLRVT